MSTRMYRPGPLPGDPTPQRRVQRGVPTGGQFAATVHGESSISLGKTREPDSTAGLVPLPDRSDFPHLLESEVPTHLLEGRPPATISERDAQRHAETWERVYSLKEASPMDQEDRNITKERNSALKQERRGRAWEQRKAAFRGLLGGPQDS